MSNKQVSEQSPKVALTQAGDIGEDITQLVPMKSGRYLLSHIIVNSGMYIVYLMT